MRQTAAWLAYVGMICPTSVFAVSPQQSGVSSSVAQPTARIQDVRLTREAQLTGQVLREDGTPAADVLVAITGSRKEISQTSTDAQGRFSFEHLNGGVYSISTAQQTQMVRAWANGAAPPSSTAGILVVDGDNGVLRGQMMDGCGQCAPACQPACQPTCDNGCGQPRCCSPFGFLANPWVIGAAVAVAIAVPLALDDDDDAS